MRFSGFTLTEMVVSLAILSILASLTLPYAEVTYRRAKEVELRRSLRIMRDAIDHFHADCEAGLIVQAQEGVSRDCFPKTLIALVEGVERNDAEGGRRFYLRRLPEDPFSDEEDVLDQWDIRGYRDEVEGRWSGDDVYDVRVNHEMGALDGSYYRNW